MSVEVNVLSVLLAAIVAMIVGFLWYSPALFGKPWIKLMGYTDQSMQEAKKSMGKMYALTFILTLITVYMLSHVMILSLNYFHYPKLVTGLTSGFSMWLGFVMPVQATDVIFGGKPWKLFGINTGYQLVALLAMGVVIGLM